MKEEKALFGPGPCNISIHVREAMARPMLGHLDPDFLLVMESCKARLRHVMRTNNAITFPVSGTGSAGMELLLLNFVEPGDRIVVGVNGVFGGRIAKLASKLGAEVTVVEAPWGEALPHDTLLSAVQCVEPRLLALVHGETSTGVHQSINGLGEAVHHVGGLLMVDCVTSLAGMSVDIDAWGVDLAFSGTQKCLACPPGLAPVSISERARERWVARQSPVPSFYFDLEQILAYMDGQGGRTYHHTAPVSLVQALNEALGDVLEEGLEARFERHRNAAAHLIEGMQALGFKPLVHETDRLHPLTTLRPPPGVDEARLRQTLMQQHRIEIGSGLGPLAGEVLRIGLMGGNATLERVEFLLHAISRTLD